MYFHSEPLNDKHIYNASAYDNLLVNVCVCVCVFSSTIQVPIYIFNMSQLQQYLHEELGP